MLSQDTKVLSVSLIGGFITILIIASLLGTALGESIMAITPVGEFPQALEYNPSNNYIYVANRDSGTVSVIDSTNNTVIRNITVGSSPGPLVFNPSNNYIYVANAISNTISVIDSTNNTVIRNITVGSSPGPLVFNPSNNYIYVANRD